MRFGLYPPRSWMFYWWLQGRWWRLCAPLWKILPCLRPKLDVTFQPWPGRLYDPWPLARFLEKLSVYPLIDTALNSEAAARVLDQFISSYDPYTDLIWLVRQYEHREQFVEVHIPTKKED